ncbi:MAG: zinc-binding dehydrogenase [Gammaproteobacteria bacterium]
MATVNRQWKVARHPQPGELINRDHFEWHESAIPGINNGEFLVHNEYLTPIPAQRGYLDANQSALLGEPIPAGEVMRGRGIGQVIESRHPNYQQGDVFVGSLGWQDFSVHKPAEQGFVFSTTKIEKPRQPLSLHMGILGQAGGTAYCGLTEGGGIKPGDNVLISAAAGGVGSCAGQIARLLGANTVVGITGSHDKSRWLVDTLGYTAAINHQTDRLDEKLAELFPDGIDLYLDGIGGEMLNTALNHLAMNARISVLGYLSTQYEETNPTLLTNHHQLLFKRASMQGCIYFDYWNRYQSIEKQLCEWFDSGELINTEYLTKGLENMPSALADLFTGGNQGIAVCSI